MSVTTLALKCDGKAVDAVHHLLGVDIGMEVNRIGWATLEFNDGEVGTRSFPISDSGFFVPGVEVEILARIEGETQDTGLFKGLVVKQSLEMTPEGGLVLVKLKDPAVKLTSLRRSRLFEKKSDGEIMADLLEGLLAGQVPKTDPVHETLIQYSCSDWDFLLARAELNGLLIAAEHGEVRLSKPQVSGKPKHQFNPGLDLTLNFEYAVDGEDQVGSVASVGWDLAKGKPSASFKAAKGEKVAPGNLDGAVLGKALGAEERLLNHPVHSSSGALQAWADGDLARRRLAMVRGRLSLPGRSDLRLLDVVEVSGCGLRYNGKTLITGIRHRIDDQWRTDVQFGISARRVARRFDQGRSAGGGFIAADSRPSHWYC